MAIDFMRERSPAEWAALLRARRVDAVVNCVGILIPDAGASFARVHTEGPIELFRGAALAGVGRVVQVSALGIRDGGEPDEADYLRRQAPGRRGAARHRARRRRGRPPVAGFRTG
jgi:hypothetical protein